MLENLGITCLTRLNLSANVSIGTCTKKVLKTKKNKLSSRNGSAKGRFFFYTKTKKNLMGQGFSIGDLLRI